MMGRRGKVCIGGFSTVQVVGIVLGPLRSASRPSFSGLPWTTHIVLRVARMFQLIHTLCLKMFTGLRERCKREKSEGKIDCHHQNSNPGPSLEIVGTMEGP